MGRRKETSQIFVPNETEEQRAKIMREKELKNYNYNLRNIFRNKRKT